MYILNNILLLLIGVWPRNSWLSYIIALSWSTLLCLPPRDCVKTWTTFNEDQDNIASSRVLGEGQDSSFKFPFSNDSTSSPCRTSSSSRFWFAKSSILVHVAFMAAGGPWSYVRMPSFMFIQNWSSHYRVYAAQIDREIVDPRLCAEIRASLKATRSCLHPDSRISYHTVLLELMSRW